MENPCKVFWRGGNLSTVVPRENTSSSSLFDCPKTWKSKKKPPADYFFPNTKLEKNRRLVGAKCRVIQTLILIEFTLHFYVIATGNTVLILFVCFHHCSTTWLTGFL